MRAQENAGGPRAGGGTAVRTRTGALAGWAAGPAGRTSGSACKACTGGGAAACRQTGQWVNPAEALPACPACRSEPSASPQACPSCPSWPSWPPCAAQARVASARPTNGAAAIAANQSINHAAARRTIRRERRRSCMVQESTMRSIREQGAAVFAAGRRRLIRITRAPIIAGLASLECLPCTSDCCLPASPSSFSRRRGASLRCRRSSIPAATPPRTCSRPWRWRRHRGWGKGFKLGEAPRASGGRCVPAQEGEHFRLVVVLARLEFR